MKRILILLYLFLTVIQFNTLAQETTVYFKSPSEPTNKKNAVRYVKFGTQINGLIPYKMFTMKDQLVEEGYSLNNHSVIRHGVSSVFYPDGKIYIIQEFVRGVPAGLTTQYFKNGNINYKSITDHGRSIPGTKQIPVQYLYSETIDGKITLADGNGYFQKYDDSLHIIEEGNVKNNLATGEWKGIMGGMPYKEEYTDGMLISGESTDEAGKKYPYKVISKLPEPRGGLQAFYNGVMRDFKFPRDASPSEIMGQLMLQFYVDKDGSLKDIKVIQSLNFLVDQEVIRVLRNLPNWIPAEQRGKPVKVSYTLPVKLS